MPRCVRMKCAKRGETPQPIEVAERTAMGRLQTTARTPYRMIMREDGTNFGSDYLRLKIKDVT
jgi:hypothetical protein